MVKRSVTTPRASALEASSGSIGRSEVLSLVEVELGGGTAGAANSPVGAGLVVEDAVTVVVTVTVTALEVVDETTPWAETTAAKAKTRRAVKARIFSLIIWQTIFKK
jgi:hypothetical protein